MRYFSLNNTNNVVDFREATLQGQAPDGGLYYPENIPVWNDNFIGNLKRKSKSEIGFEIMAPYVGNTIPENELHRIIAETLDFDFPLQPISENIYSLELFHGPTLAFKDVGARFLSRCMGFFAGKLAKKIVVLVATSGDTGGAVADAFHNISGTEVIILYPSGKVSPVQEKQLTALGGNIHALEIEGDFDDCQKLVKMAFLDEELRKRVMLTSSNSINVARWLPQQIYYALALTQWEEHHDPVIAVPSGNFGNLSAGLVAKQSGLPIDHFIAACNANDVFTAYTQSGNYHPRSAVPTLSNAMDVGNPSNFSRILALFQHDHQRLCEAISSISVSDVDTLSTIKEVYAEFQYTLDPHAAVAYNALKDHLKDHAGQKGIILGTAHPVKFPSVVQEAIGHRPSVPENLGLLMKKNKSARLTPPEYASFKATVMDILKNI
ncbi:MAG: threonine synthase [Chitinophagaceae bacterium]|nr:threonine synthase [Chitinophagaceae bacterium]